MKCLSLLLWSYRLHKSTDMNFIFCLYSIWALMNLTSVCNEVNNFMSKSSNQHCVGKSVEWFFIRISLDYLQFQQVIFKMSSLTTLCETYVVNKNSEALLSNTFFTNIKVFKGLFFSLDNFVPKYVNYITVYI